MRPAMNGELILGKKMVQRNPTHSACGANRDADGESEVESGRYGRGAFGLQVPFLDHMLDQIVRHGLMDLTVKATGDAYWDDHFRWRMSGLRSVRRLPVGDKRAWCAMVLVCAAG